MYSLQVIHLNINPFRINQDLFPVFPFGSYFSADCTLYIIINLVCHAITSNNWLIYCLVILKVI